MSNFNKKFTVYMHISPTNKYYIGVTSHSNIYKRWGKNGYGYHTQIKFYRAIKKYGWDNFKHIIIVKDTTENEALELEQKLIIKYDAKNNGYNSDDGGKGSFGHIVSPKTKLLLSEKGKLRKWTPEQHLAVLQRKKMDIFIYNVTGDLLKICNGYAEAALFLNAKKNTIINCCNYNKIFQNNYIILCQKNIDMLQAIIKNYQKRITDYKIYQYSIDGQLLNKFISYKAASEATGIPIGCIGKVCCGFDLKYKNFIFLKTEDSILCRLAKIKEQAISSKANQYKKYIVEQYDLDNNLIATYNSFKEAALKTGLDKKCISANCRAKSLVCKGYIFKKIIKN